MVDKTLNGEKSFASDIVIKWRSGDWAPFCLEGDFCWLLFYRVEACLRYGQNRERKFSLFRAAPSNTVPAEIAVLLSLIMTHIPFPFPRRKKQCSVVIWWMEAWVMDVSEQTCRWCCERQLTQSRYTCYIPSALPLNFKWEHPRAEGAL